MSTVSPLKWNMDRVRTPANGIATRGCEGEHLPARCHFQHGIVIAHAPQTKKCWEVAALPLYHWGFEVE